MPPSLELDLLTKIFLLRNLSLVWRSRPWNRSRARLLILGTARAEARSIRMNPDMRREAPS